MNNLLKYSVLAISIGLATACSGGGGGDDNNDTPNPTYDKKEVNANTQVPSINYVRDDLKVDVRAAKQLTIFDPVTRDTIKVMQLSDYPEGIIKETFQRSGNASTSYARIINQAYSSSMTFHTNESAEIAYNSFYGGYVTKIDELPKGTATYQGSSLGINAQGLLALTADFDRKRVEGKIYNRRQNDGNALNDITLESTSIQREFMSSSATNKSIAAAVFDGYTTTSDGMRGKYEGTFAGPNAEEVVGVLTDVYGNDVYEGFAGKKQ